MPAHLGCGFEKPRGNLLSGGEQGLSEALSLSPGSVAGLGGRGAGQHGAVPSSLQDTGPPHDAHMWWHPSAVRHAAAFGGYTAEKRHCSAPVPGEGTSHGLGAGADTVLEGDS